MRRRSWRRSPVRREVRPRTPSKKRPRSRAVPSPSEARERAAARIARETTPPRDQEASTFAAILNDLVVRLPGAFAAALVDGEGETVDYGGKVDPFDAKINAAHWRLVLAELSSTQ